MKRENGFCPHCGEPLSIPAMAWQLHRRGMTPVKIAKRLGKTENHIHVALSQYRKANKAGHGEKKTESE